MPSVGPMNAGLKNTGGFFIPVGNCLSKVFAYTEGSGAGGSFTPGNFVNAPWADVGTATAINATSTINTAGAGGVFRDMGKTVVSASRVFRKVQLLVSSAVSTGGVSGQNGSSPDVDYLTGYIELMSGNNGPTPTALNAAPVAYYPSQF